MFEMLRIFRKGHRTVSSSHWEVTPSTVPGKCFRSADGWGVGWVSQTGSWCGGSCMLLGRNNPPSTSPEPSVPAPERDVIISRSDGIISSRSPAVFPWDLARGASSGRVQVSFAHRPTGPQRVIHWASVLCRSQGDDEEQSQTKQTSPTRCPRCSGSRGGGGTQ